MVRNGSGQFGHRTLKLTLSQEWIDGMNWYFACKLWLQSYFNDFLVGRVRNGHVYLNHETLKSVSKEWVYELNWFFACWLWGSCICWIPGSSWKGRMKCFCPSFHPAACWSVFLEWVIRFLWIATLYSGLVVRKMPHVWQLHTTFYIMVCNSCTAKRFMACDENNLRYNNKGSP